MTGQLNAAEADRIDERRRRLRPDDTALAQQANAPSGRSLLEYARGAIPPRVLGSPRNHRRHGAGLLGAVPQCAIGSREIVGGAGSGRHTFPPFSLSSRVASIIADAVSMAAPDRRIGEWQSSWRCLVHSARQGFATTASTLTGPVFEYRRHQSSSAMAGPKLHEHEFGGVRGQDHQEPAIPPESRCRAFSLAAAGRGKGSGVSSVQQVARYDEIIRCRTALCRRRLSKRVSCRFEHGPRD